MYIVFEIAKERSQDSDKVLRDDLISRQSIIVRDARSIDIDKNVQYIIIDGSEEALTRAKVLFGEVGKALSEDDGKPIYDKIKVQDEAAASGVGMIFGD